MIKNLIFDFGKVLVDYDYFQLVDQFFEDKNKEAEFSKIFLTEEWSKRIDGEFVPFDQLKEQALAELPQFKKEVAMFFDRYPEFITNEMPGMRNLIKQLKSEGYHIYGLSNWCSKVYVTMNQYKEIFSLLDGYVISSEEKLIKPEPGIYNRLFEKFELKPEECIFTDDKPENIEGSKKCGMDAILFKNASQYEKELRKKLNKN